MVDPSERRESHVARKPGFLIEEIDRITNNESGILGISGAGNDMRDVSAHAAAGDPRCMLALDMYAYRINPSDRDVGVNVGRVAQTLLMPSVG
jgi:acetate kinase